jgi:D-glycerate 3-kinase
MSENQITPHVVRWITRAVETAPPGHAPLLFLSGPQGSGKSTALAEAVAALKVPVAGLGLDDAYLTQAERERLALEVSPLFRTRGPPGTHDLGLLRALIADLRGAGARSVTALPVFDKLADERAPRAAWRRFAGRPAAIVVEGWLMGVDPDPEAPDLPPINSVEAADSGKAWRRHQEAVLARDYAPLWDATDGFLHIVPPGFDCVLDWRLQQEAALWAARGEALPPERRAWVAGFIEHYERLTRRMIDGHRRPGTEVHIDAARRVRGTSAGG